MAKIEYKTLKMDETCFPRVHFLMTRLRNIHPRMNRILNFVFHKNGYGVKQLRSDVEKRLAIEGSIENTTVTINVMYGNENLCNVLSPQRLAIGEFKDVTKKHASKLNSRKCPDDLKSNILLFPVEADRLQDLDCVKDPSSCVSHAIIAVFDRQERLNRPHEWLIERETKKQFVTVRPITSTTVQSSSEQQQSIALSVARQQVPSTTEPRSRHFSDGCLTTNQPSSSSQIVTRSSIYPLTLPRMSMNVLGAANVDTGSIAELREEGQSSKKERPFSPIDSNKSSHHTDAKRRRHESDSRYELKGDSDQHDLHMSRSHASVTSSWSPRATNTEVTSYSYEHGLYTNISWNLEPLKQCIQYHLEVKTTDVIKSMVTYLKQVRDRLEQSEKATHVTILDKLIYEIEGLLSVSYTDTGREMKQKFEQQAMNHKLQDELLGIDGIRGCGTFYHRINIHLTQDERIVKEELLKKISEVMTKYNYSDDQYDTHTVRINTSGDIVLLSV